MLDAHPARSITTATATTGFAWSAVSAVPRADSSAGAACRRAAVGSYLAHGPSSRVANGASNLKDGRIGISSPAIDADQAARAMAQAGSLRKAAALLGTTEATIRRRLVARRLSP